MSSSAIRAGGAFVELFTQEGKFNAGMLRAELKLKAFAASAQAVGSAVMRAGAVMTAPFAAAVGVFSSTGDALHKMAQRTGASVEALSQLKFAAGQSGSSLEAVEQGLKKMSLVVDTARRGSATAAETLARLGLSAEQLAARRPEQQLELFADALARIPDAAARAAAAQQVFGAAGTQLLPLLAGGAAGLRQLRQQADELGLTMSTGAANDAADLTDAWGELRGQLQALSFAVGGAVGKSLAEWIRQSQAAISQAIAWVKENEQLVAKLAALAASVAAGGVAIKGLGLVVSGAASAVGLLRTATVACSGALRTLGSWLAASGLPTVVAWSLRIGDAIRAMSRMQLAAAGLKMALAGALATGVWVAFAATAQAQSAAVQRAVQTMTATSLASLHKLRADTKRMLDETDGISPANLRRLTEERDRRQRDLSQLEALAKTEEQGVAADRDRIGSVFARFFAGIVGMEGDSALGNREESLRQTQQHIERLREELLPLEAAIERQQSLLESRGASTLAAGEQQEAPAAAEQAAAAGDREIDPALLQALAERAAHLQTVGTGLLARAAAGAIEPQDAAAAADRLGGDLHTLSAALRQAGLSDAAQGVADRATLFDDLAASLSVAVDPARLRTAAEASQADRLQVIDAQSRAGRFDLAAELAQSAAAAARQQGDQLAERFFANQAEHLRRRADQTARLDETFRELPRTLAKSSAQNRALELGSTEAIAAIAGVLSPEERHNRRMEELQRRNVAASERAASETNRVRRRLEEAPLITEGRV